MSEHYYLIAIGGGPAGEAAASVAAFFGHPALIVEANRPGGTVTTTGGAPTKTLREAALFLTGAGSREIYGVEIGEPPTVVFPVIRQRTTSVAGFLQDVMASNFRDRRVQYAQGTARLGPNRTVHLTEPDGNERVLTADTIMIATGSKPLRPATVEFDDPDVWDSDEVWELGRIPDDVFIVGGGPIGVEFATVFHALGAHVTLADGGPRLLQTMDGEMAELVTEHLVGHGVHVLLGVRTQSVQRVEGRLEVRLSDGSVHHPETVLFAAGRVPNTAGLDLEAAGIEVDQRGRIRVDDAFETTAPRIYAVGDVVAPTLASMAAEQGRVAVSNALKLGFNQKLEVLPVSAVYSMPEVAAVGRTEEQCKQEGIAYGVGRCDLSRLPRGAIAGHPGRLKLIVNIEDGRLLGVHCFGDIASEVVGVGQMVIYFQGRVDDLLASAFNTPTYSSAYSIAAYDAVEQMALAVGGPDRLVQMALAQGRMRRPGSGGGVPTAG